METVKLLVIDGDANQRRRIGEALEDSFGPEIVVVSVGTRREAMALDVQSFQLILSDYQLPDATGLQVLAQVRALCGTPVVLMTGESAAHLAEEWMRKGAADCIVKSGDDLDSIPVVVRKNLLMAKVRRENEQLRAELECALQEVCDKNAQLERSLLKVEELAATDPLTGLYNRRHFANVFDRLFSESCRHDTDLSCMMIDLDKYKSINDTCGHQAGDEVLMLAAKVIRNQLRPMDAAARFGGDEFVLLLPETSAAETEIVARRIRQAFKPATALLLGRAEGISMSIGIGSVRANQPSHPDQLIAAADKALYRSKESGRDRATLCDSPLAA